MDIEQLFKNHSEAVQAKLEELGLNQKIAREQLRELEQKMARQKGGGFSYGASDSYGAQVLANDEFKAFREGGSRGRARIEVKAITSAQTAFSERDPEYAAMARRTVRVRDLLTVIPTTSGSVDWVKQTTRTNNAAVVAEEALKPTSAYIWEKKNTPMRTIAHLAKLTRQALDDDAQLAAELNTEMLYGLTLAEDAELLSGDGTGEHLTGLIPAATAYSAPFEVIDANEIDIVGLAVLQASLTEFPPDGIVINPSRWMKMRLLKDADGKYIMGDPAANVEPVLFGLPVAATQAMSATKFLTGAFKMQKLYDRMAPEILIATENSDDFEHNLLTARCEERLALAVRKPTALVYGDFDTALAA